MTYTAVAAGKIQPRLKQKYRSEIAPQLQRTSASPTFTRFRDL